MRGTTERSASLAMQVRSRIGLLLGTAALFWSAQILAKDQTLPGGTRPEQSEAPRHVLVVSIADRKLAVMEAGQVVKLYPVAGGAASSPSPSGTWKIVNKTIGPTWYHKGKAVPPGKSNPLGNRWMGLDKAGYGIHGTNDPNSIGKAVSHGCIRMAKQDVEELFKLAQVGDVVEIHGERDAQVTLIFGRPAVEVADSGHGLRDMGYGTQSPGSASLIEANEGAE